MESIILTAKVTGIEQSIIAGARSAEKALIFRPKIDASGLTKLSGPLGRLNSQATEFNKSLEASNARVLAFGASAGAIFAVQKGLQSVVKDAIEVEKVLADINSVLNQTTKGLAKFTDEIFDAAKNAGTSFKVASEAALELSRQGLSAEATTKRLNAALILARLGGLDAKDAVEGLTAAINSFNNEALDDVDIVNRLANVSAKFAVSEKDLTEAIKRSASAASDAGVSFNELVALVTSAQQTTARGGAVIGNALKTIFTRLQRSDTLEQLEALGVAVRGVNNDLLSAPQILKNLSSVYGDLNKEQKNFISELVGGGFQINQLKAQLNDLSKDYGTYSRALTEASDVTSTAIQRNEELNKTTAASFNAISVSITKLSAIAGGEILKPLFQNIEGISKFFLDALSPEKGAEAGKGIGEGILKGIGSALSGPGLLLAGAGLFALFIRLGSFAKEAGKSILDNVRGIERQRQVQAEVESLLAQSGKSYADIVRGATSLEQVEKRILAIVREQLALRASASSLTANLSPGIASGGGFGFGQSKLNSAGLGFSAGKLYTRETPRFADPIREAINREKAAGVPASSIYIDKDPRVKSPSNPLGILVANRRDEPMGGYQGVNRAISLGMDPKKGTGNGYIPNFAEFDKTSKVVPGPSVYNIKGFYENPFEKEIALAANEAKKLRSLASKVRTAGNPEDFASAVKNFKTYADSLGVASSGMVKINSVISSSGAKLGKAMAERAEEEKIQLEKGKIAYELASQKAKQLEQDNQTRAKAFKMAGGGPIGSIGLNDQLSLAPSNKQANLTFEQKAKQLGFEKVSSSSGLGSKDEKAIEDFYKDKVKVERAGRKLREKASREFAKQRAEELAAEKKMLADQMTNAYGSPIGPNQPQGSNAYKFPIGPTRVFSSGGNRVSTAQAQMVGPSEMSSGMGNYTPYNGILPSQRSALRRQIAQAKENRNEGLIEESISRFAQTGRKFTRAQNDLILKKAEEAALNAPEFTGFTQSQILNDPKARKIFDKKVNEAKSAILETASFARFDSTLSSTFSKRETGLSGIFGREKSDISAFRKNLGLKEGQNLTPQQQVALENRLQQTRQLRSGRLTTAGIAGSFGLSTLAGSGLIGDGIGAGITQGAATGLSLGSFFGPYGMAAGAIGGGALGAASAIGDEPQKKFQKTAEAYKQLSQELENSTNNAQSYANVQAQLSDLIASGVAKESDISNLNGKLTDLFNSIGDNETRKNILSAGGNMKALNQAVADLANKNAAKLATESVKVAGAYAKSNAIGGFLSGKSIKSEDLVKLGQALASTTNLTSDELSTLEERLAKVSKGGSFGQVNALLGKFGYDITELSTNVEDALITLGSAVRNSKFKKEIEQNNKDLANYESKLVEFNKSFNSLVSSLLEQSRLKELQLSANREIGLARYEGNLQLASGGSTEVSMINNQALLSKAKLAASFADDNASLNASTQDKIREFVSKNLNSTEQKNFQQRTSGGFDPLKELGNLVSLSQDSFKNGKDSFNELRDIKDAAESGFNSLAITQNKNIALLEQSNQVMKELARRRDLGSIFGGAGGLGQGLDTSAIYEGARAGAAVNARNRVKNRTGNSRYLSQEDIGNQITEAKGLIEQSNLFPGLVDAFRTPENRGRVQEANKSDIINKNRQVLASSLKGIFEGEFKSGGAFGPGGDVTGGDLQRRLYSALTLDKTKGGTDYSAAQKILETSTLGIRNPKTLARLKGAVGAAAQTTGIADEAAKAKTDSQFATPAELQDKFITDLAKQLRGADVAVNTEKTVKEIQRLNGIFEKQVPLAQKIEEIKKVQGDQFKQEGFLTVVKNKKGDFVKNLELGKQDLSTTTFIPGVGVKTYANEKFKSMASKFSNGRIGRNNSVSPEIADAIGQGGSIPEIVDRIKRNTDTFGFSNFTKSLAGSNEQKDKDQALRDFIVEFAGDDQKKKFSDFNDEIKTAEEVLGKLGNTVKVLDSELKDQQTDFANFIKKEGVYTPEITTPSAPVVFNGNSELSGKAKNNVIDSLIDVENRTAQQKTIFRNGNMNELRGSTQKLAIAEGNAGYNIKEASKEGGIAFATAFSSGLNEALRGASEKTKIDVENRINSNIEVIVKDGRVTQEEIAELKEGFEKLAKAVFDLNNKDKQDKGLNTSPTINPNASGSPR